MITSWDKAIAALIGAVIPILANFGFDLNLGDGVIASISGVLAFALTYLFPNKTV